MLAANIYKVFSSASCACPYAYPPPAGVLCRAPRSRALSTPDTDADSARGVAESKCSKSQPNQSPTNPAVPVATPAGAPATGEVRTETPVAVLPIESGQFRSPPAAPPPPHGRGAIREPNARPVPEPYSQPRSAFKAARRPIGSRTRPSSDRRRSRRPPRCPPS